MEDNGPNNDNVCGMRIRTANGVVRCGKPSSTNPRAHGECDEHFAADNDAACRAALRSHLPQGLPRPRPTA